MLKHSLIALAVLAFSSLTVADGTTPKIGVVDMHKVNLESPQVKDAQIKLEKEFQSRNNDLMNKQKALQAKHESYQRDREILGDSERLKLERELTRMQQDFQRLGEEFQADLRIRQDEENRKVTDKIMSAVEQVAKQDHYDLIIPHQTTLFNANSIDVTQVVIEKMKSMDA